MCNFKFERNFFSQFKLFVLIMQRGADVIVVTVAPDGKTAVSDQFAESYGRPTLDETQSVFRTSAQYANGRLTANFSRKLDTGDFGDIPLTDCQYFLYPHSGGPAGGRFGRCQKAPGYADPQHGKGERGNKCCC